MSARSLARRIVGTLTLIAALAIASLAHAQIAIGTWERTDAAGKGMTMTVESCCRGGLRLTYRVPNTNQPPMTMTVDSPMDGSEVPLVIGGKPSGQMMSIKRIDALHFSGYMKVDGKMGMTSTSTVSADGKTITTEDTLPGGTQKFVETWVRK